MRVLLISPYHGGSHRCWAEGYRSYSRHQLHLLTLPARYWKWRMHGGAITLARRFEACGWEPDVILATDMLDLTTFLSLTRASTGHLPTVLYMHENQLTYPLPEDPRTGPMRRQLGERDLHYAFINYSSMLSAERVVFNSEFHRSSVFEALPRFLRHFPEFREEENVPELKARSSVLPVGLDLVALAPEQADANRTSPLILWNQRWEYDKDPEAFLKVILQVADEGYPFQLALCGPSSEKPPEGLERMIERLEDRVIYRGYAPRQVYGRLLREATLTISTAIHEFFGVSILEAILCRTFPILPARLSYPEIIPAPLHRQCLYGSPQDLLERLRWAITHPRETRQVAMELALQLSHYSWEKWAPRYDRLLEEVSPRVSTVR